MEVGEQVKKGERRLMLEATKIRSTSTRTWMAIWKKPPCSAIKSKPTICCSLSKKFRGAGATKGLHSANPFAGLVHSIGT